MSYPLTYPNEGDARFTSDLLGDLAQLLADRGFPPIDDDTDFAGFRNALAGFLYGPEFVEEYCR